MNVRNARTIGDIISVTNILYACGRDMANKYDIHHWDNPWIKTFLIVLICMTKNRVQVVTEKKDIATYQTKILDTELHFEKLAVKPEESHKGIGSYCLRQIENEAQENGCKKICMEVYSKSQHAIQFYTKHGYTQVGNEKTLKYDVVCFEKVLQ